MSGKNADDLARQENLEEFLSGMQTFVAGRQEEGRMDEAYLTDYLQDVALLTDADSEGEKDEPRVSLMTVHAAKGLEFATVFVVGLEENIFPSPLAAISVRELEEERRLLYVAITRAEKHCILTNAKNRFRYGKMEFDNPSRFIDEIDASLIEGGEEAPESSFGGERSSYGGYGGRMPWDRDRSGYGREYQNAKPVASQFMADPKPGFKSVRAVNAVHRIMGDTTTSSSVASAASSASNASSVAGSLSEGCRIEHQRFGIGTVLKIEGTGENTKATVEFQNAGTKQLLLKFAKFTILS